MVPGAKERPVQEFLNALLFRPLAHLVVLLLLRTPVRPHHLVLFHTGLVLGTAWLLLRGEDLGAALLLLPQVRQPPDVDPCVKAAYSVSLSPPPLWPLSAARSALLQA